MAGSAFMLVGIVATVFIARDNGVGEITFDLVKLAEHAEFPLATGRWLFFAFAIAFAVKVPIFPLHTWLPDAHTQAPTAGSVILAGVLLKLGTYGLVRFGLYLFPEAAWWSRPLFLTLGVIGIIYGAIVATMQKDLKRLVAYSSIAHLGFIILGTFAITSQALTGGVHADGQPRAVHRGAVPPRRMDLRAPSHASDRRAEGHPGRGADVRRRVHGRDAVVDRGAGAQRVHRRVPHPDRVVPLRPLVDGRRRDRRDPRRALPAVGLPARVPR